MLIYFKLVTGTMIWIRIALFLKKKKKKLILFMYQVDFGVDFFFPFSTFELFKTKGPTNVARSVLYDITRWFEFLWRVEIGQKKPSCPHQRTSAVIALHVLACCDACRGGVMISTSSGSRRTSARDFVDETMQRPPE